MKKINASFWILVVFHWGQVDDCSMLVFGLTVECTTVERNGTSWVFRIEGKGKHFDPLAVDAFSDCKLDFVKIHEKCKDN